MLPLLCSRRSEPKVTLAFICMEQSPYKKSLPKIFFSKKCDEVYILVYERALSSGDA